MAGRRGSLRRRRKSERVANQYEQGEGERRERERDERRGHQVDPETRKVV